MTDVKRGDDAADHAPKPRVEGQPVPRLGTQDAKHDQDAKNYDDRVDKGLAEPVESLNSANDK